MDYSTSETVVGRWIDGSKLYRKVVISSSLYDGQNLDLGLSNSDNIVKFHTYAKGKTAHNIYPLPDVTLRNNQFTQVYISGNKLHINTNDSWGAYDLIIIVEYTKTID